MKLTMAIGAKRHYIVQTIVGRHFMQTAKSCGFADRTAKDVIAELGDTAAQSVQRTLSGLPKDFPEKIATSIANGAKRRLNAMPLVEED
jgi:serine/threonine-protein kinase HipA